MTRTLGSLIVTLGLLTGTAAFAQESGPAPGSVEITVIPGGATFFVQGKDTAEPSFGNYALGGAVSVNFNRYIGVEGEVGSSLGVSQTLEFPTVSRDLKSPNMLQYNGNLVVSAANRTSVVPYLTGGIGGLTLFDKAALNIADTTTFLTGNAGGGVKWYAGRWGLRADYRFIAVRSQSDAPAFFGNETRYGHRLYGGVLLNIR
jgi:hypothetical protein